MLHILTLVVSLHRLGQVKSLELRLEASKAQAAEANRAAAEDLRGRVSAHERDLVELEAAVSAAEEGGWFRRRKHACDYMLCLTCAFRNFNPLESVIVVWYPSSWLVVSENSVQTDTSQNGGCESNIKEIVDFPGAT